MERNSDDVWESVAKNYEFIEGAQLSNSFIILVTLSESKEPLSTTQISEKNSNWFKRSVISLWSTERFIRE